MASIYIIALPTILNRQIPLTCNESEISLGTKFYQLIWLDTAITAVWTVVSAMGFKYFWKSYQFDLSSSILEIVYRQSIIWYVFDFHTQLDYKWI